AVRHTLGMGYLAELMHRPHQIVDAAKLYGVVLIEAGLEASDRRSRRDIRKAIDAAGSARTRAKEEGATDVRTILKTALARDFDRVGKPRTQGGSHERARQSVQKAIQVALVAIARASPALGAHLKRAISTGHECGYLPSEPMLWKIIS